MKQITFYVVFLAVLGVGRLRAESGRVSMPPGVTLSVWSSNRVVTSFTGLELNTRLTNSCEAVLEIYDTGSPMYDYNILLSDNSGKQYELVPRKEFLRNYSHNRSLHIGPAQAYDKRFYIRIPEELPPAKYIIKCQRRVKIADGSKWVLVSNPLEVEIRKASGGL